MIHRLRRLAARFLAIGLLAGTLFTVDAVASPSPAEARCDGVNNPVWSNWVYGYLRASETPSAGTCNENNFYTGVLKDERADGWCVSVWFTENSLRNWYRASSILCGVGETTTFQYEDWNGNSRAYQRFCVHRASDLSVVECGWGTTVRGEGTNHGY